ncbi:MAG: SDR family oxidoreductase [Chloroflexi bacterium]|nr:SDR family oxidoreductase [Chloroflexota bacterium]
MSNIVFVTGATGNIGSLVVAGLLARDVKVRALVHSEEKAPALRDQGVEVFVGDFTDAAILDQAIAGADRVFSLTPPNPDQVAQANAITAAALRASNRPHIVRMSVIKSNTAAPTRISAQHGEIDKVLKESGLPVTFLKPHFFMQNTLMGAESVGDHGALYHSMGDGKIGIIDVRDIAAVAIEVLTTDGHEGKGYTLTGPESISFAQIGRQLAEALGKDVNVVAVPVDAARESMTGLGFPQWMADAFGEYFEAYSNNYGDFFTDDVQNITGTAARSYRDFASDFAGAFG